MIATVRNSLTLCTINLGHGRGTAAHQIHLRKAKIKANLDRIAQVVREEGVDVVALQEVDAPSVWTGKFNHLEYLSSMSGLSEYYLGVHMDRLGLQYGTGLLSRYVLTDRFNYKFINGKPFPPKGFVFAALPVSETQSVDVVSLHLDFLRRRVRFKQIDFLVNTLGARSQPAIVMGDFNCDWGSPDSALRIVSQELQLQVFAPEASDQSTFPATDKRWDWILIPETCTFLQYYCVKETLSDHRAVIARVEIAL